jgi:hypothetical protein
MATMTKALAMATHARMLPIAAPTATRIVRVGNDDSISKARLEAMSMVAAM